MTIVQTVELLILHQYLEQTFKANNDESIFELSQSIKENGLINPIIVRKKDNGRYELISGHRRKWL